MRPLRSLFRSTKDDHASEASALAQGEALFAQGRLAEALAVADRALESDPSAAGLHFARGTTLFAWDRYREAYESYVRAHDAGLDDIDLDLHLGWMSVNLGRMQEALGHLERAVARDPGSEVAYVALSNALETMGRLKDRASESAEELARWPHNYDAILLRATCRMHLGERDTGLAIFREATLLDPSRPRAWSNVAAVLIEDDRYDEALEAARRGHKADRALGTGEGLFNYATILREVGRIDDAVAVLEEALSGNPDPRIHWLRSTLLLEQGRYPEAWPQHEYRWMKEPLVAHRRVFGHPIWGGQGLRDKTILLTAEQGLGDAIQFIRFAKTLKALGARVLFDSFADLGEIAHDFRDVDEVLAEGRLPAFDYQISLLGLPRVLGITVDSIPAHVPYIDVVPAFRAKWAPRIRHDGRLRVGLVWSGNPEHVRDRMRSIPLPRLAALGSVEGIALHSLQKSPGAEVEIAASGLDIVDLGSDFASFRDTAAAISLLDLVITVDTSVAHLAGALGCPTWIMIAEPPDWRWLLEGDRTPWYPSMRIFRQRKRNDWEPVIAEVVTALTTYAMSPRDETWRTRLLEGGAGQGGSASSGPPASVAAEAPRIPDPAATARRLTAGRFCGVDETRYGIVQWQPGTDVALSLSYYGEWRQAELDLIGRFVKPGSWIIDEGCGPGAATLFLARAAGEAGHVIAYEPDRVLGQIVRQNLAANRVGNVTFLARSLGGTRAVAQLPAGGAATDTLDDLRLSRLDWIRLNSGRSAAATLTGGTETLWRLRPWVFVVTGSESDESDVAAVLRDHGYQCRRFRAPLFNAANYNRRTEDLFDGRIAMGLLGIPEEVEIDVALEHCTPIDPA
jgi:tetratricopeptide (TPR) repeat protein